MTAGPSSLPSGAARVLAVCDGLLREIGRREHRFAWLRSAQGTGEDWLVVDGYYPANKLVVYCGSDPDEHRLYEQLVPQHGLYFLGLTPEQLPDDPLAAQAVVRKQLENDGWSPRPVSRPVAAVPEPVSAVTKPVSAVTKPVSAVPRPVAAVPTPASATEAKPGHWTEVRTQATATAAPQSTQAGFGIGLVLILLVLVEAYLGLVVLAIGDGDVVLGLGLVLDAAARVLGTLSAKRWSSLLVGSPDVARQELPAKGVAIAALILIALGALLAIL